MAEEEGRLMGTPRFLRWRTASLLAVAALVITACGNGEESPGAGGSPGTGGSPGDGGEGVGEVTMISSQLVPTAEQEMMNNEILANVDGTVTFIGAEAGPFNDQIRAEAEAGEGEISLIGG